MFFLQERVFGNRIADWADALVLLVVLTFLFVVTKRLLARRFRMLSEARDGLREMIAEILRRTRSLVLFLIALYLASQRVELSERIEDMLRGVAFVAALVQIGIWGSYFIQNGLKRYMSRRTAEPVSHSGIAVMVLFGRILLWAFVFLLIMENLGVNVTTLIASLGVGGIAIGLATQNILGDLFASLSILLDRPFEAGHFIIIDGYMGTVEQVGLKTTRIRSVNGELLVFGNNDLLKSRIRNFANFRERRIIFTFGVLYDTPAEKLRRIPGMVREIVEKTASTRFDRAHFKAFGNSSLDFEVVYYVLSPDYVIYMDIQQNINLAIFEAFEKEGIGFAFPTRTIHLAGGAPAPLPAAPAGAE